MDSTNKSLHPRYNRNIVESGVKHPNTNPMHTDVTIVVSMLYFSLYSTNSEIYICVKNNLNLLRLQYIYEWCCSVSMV